MRITENIYETYPIDKKAVEKVIGIKGRSFKKGIPIVVGSKAMLSRFVAKPSKIALKFIDKFWPGPLSLVLDNRRLPKILEGNNKSVLARVSSAPLFQRLFKGINFPLTSTSANRSGDQNPKSASYVERKLAKNVDLIIDGGYLKSNNPSTILDLRSGKPTILREGKISKRKIYTFYKRIIGHE